MYKHQCQKINSTSQTKTDINNFLRRIIKVIFNKKSEALINEK